MQNLRKSSGAYMNGECTPEEFRQYLIDRIARMNDHVLTDLALHLAKWRDSNANNR